MLYRVYVPLMGCNQYVVNADSEEDARNRVAAGKGTCQKCGQVTEVKDTGVWDVDDNN